MSTRRAILKLIGAVPFAGNVATKTIAAELASPAVATAIAAAGMTGPPAGQTGLAGALGPILGPQLSALANRAVEERHFLSMLRQDGFDHDIAALKSCSRAYKVAKQHERDCATIAFFQAMQTKIWC